MQTLLKYLGLFFTLILFSNCKKDLSDIISESEEASFIIYTYDEYGCPSGSASGFFITKEGIGITNYHALDGATKSLLITSDSSKYEIDKILGSDEKKDLIKFQIKNSGNKTFSYLNFSTKSPTKGDKVYCISNPLGLESSFTEGNISAIRKDKNHGKTIQFSAPISPGSSGGAVLNEDGDIVAIATYTKKGGQNLNFGVALNNDLLNSISDDEFTKKNPKFSKRDNFVILNVKSDNDPFVILNAIEFGENLTTLYMTYTNVRLTENNTNWGIWLELNKKDEGFYLKDITNNTKHYVISSTVGEDAEHPTPISIATSLRYKVFFPKINSKIKNLGVIEGTDSRLPNWANINLDEYKDLLAFDIEKFKNVYAFSLMEEGNIEESENMFYDIVSNNPEDIEALNTLGVISFVRDNNSDAITYFSKAIEANPSTPVSYINRSFTYKGQGNIQLAIDDISKAINVAPTQPDYYRYREKLYLIMGNKVNAFDDFKKANELYAKQFNYEKWDVDHLTAEQFYKAMEKYYKNEN
ncbi:MAG: trypsin-like peptidase domain-containing protein [Bacteroidia bacterium]